jgi:hypothetical protein
VPPTPIFPGEPIGPRDDEPRWFEPVAAAPNIRDGLTAAEDDWSASADPGAPAREGIAWRDIRWVEFGAADEPSEEGAPEHAASAPAPQSDPQPISALSPPPPEPAAPVLPQDVPVASGASEGAAGGRQRKLHRRLAAGFARLLRMGAAAVALVVFAVFLYHGGEMLAGFAGAMTRPSQPPEPAAPPMTATSVEPDRLPVPERLPPTAAKSPEAAVGQRAAEYLDRARGGEPAAQYNLAVLYALGDGVARDYAAAGSWFRKAAENGHPAAQFNLGVMYERGLGLPPDSAAAFSWYRRAAERGYPAAEYNLALAYAEGRGTGQDAAAAGRWYHDAAVQGVVPAMVNVAILYETGEGVARSLPDAYAWYRAAARRGDTAAGERALALFQHLTGADKARAVLMAAAVAEAMLEPLPGLPSAAGPGGLPTGLKPAVPSSSRPGDAGPARRHPAG